MKFALINGQRQEAQPNLSGSCTTCNRPMIAKCGEVKVWHWAHQGILSCDPWWESETEWHRGWKAIFPADWQEIVHSAATGERHIADVKTDHGWVMEFQHSYLKPQERRSRDTFYEKLVWIVDGTRRKNDQKQLLETWEESMPVGGNSEIRRVFFPEECRLLREWGDGMAPVFFDFGEEQWLWWLFAKGANGTKYVSRFSRSSFVAIFRYGSMPAAQNFYSLLQQSNGIAAQYEDALRQHSARNALPRTLAYPIRRRPRL